LTNPGREGYRHSIRGDIRIAEELFVSVDRHREFEAHSINLSIASFRYVPRGISATDPGAHAYLGELHEALLQALQSGGQLFLSNVIVRGRYLLRACIVNFRTLHDDIEAVPAIIASEGRQLDKAMRPNHLAV
jgi:glutamate/tyrosine decarboxylase-like PLP-dependent enzyme